jgi:hypothetical protein
LCLLEVRTGDGSPRINQDASHRAAATNDGDEANDEWPRLAKADRCLSGGLPRHNQCDRNQSDRAQP